MSQDYMYFPQKKKKKNLPQSIFLGPLRGPRSLAISVSCFFYVFSLLRTKTMNLLVFLAALCLLSPAFGGQTFQQSEIWEGWSFFDNFYFYSGSDPTHGYVYYTTHQQAKDWGLINVNAKNQVLMQPDSWSISSGSGRASVRIQSNEKWTAGSRSYLYVLDLEHMPTGCGTWPAFWMCGPNWPSGGEIDIIEGVNVNTQNQVSLHTSNGCGMYHDSSNQFTGHMGNQNCAYQPGCGISNAGAYGSALNNVNGGVYATEYSNTGISVWWFQRNNIPSDLAQNSTKANPSAWGKPAAYFPIGGGDCPSSHFYDLDIIFDLTFCGDWAGAVFGSNCPGKGSCNSYVQNNPSAFKQAYWLINFLKIMKA